MREDAKENIKAILILAFGTICIGLLGYGIGYSVEPKKIYVYEDKVYRWTPKEVDFLTKGRDSYYIAWKESTSTIEEYCRENIPSLIKDEQ